MIAPLGVVSIGFIIIQPVLIGTWSTLALFAAVAVLIQIPYSLDELLASVQFVRRRVNAGQNALRVFLFGDTDDGRETAGETLELDRSAGAVLKEAIAGGVSLPWPLAVVALIGVSLMFTRITLGAEGTLANAHHLIGALTLTVVSVAAAEVARPARFLNVPLGAALLVVPFVYGANMFMTVVTIACGAAIIGLTLRGGAIKERYGAWTRWAAA